LATFIRGDVVVVPFPFSFNAVRRPALVLAELTGDDVILCQITSQARDRYALPLTETDFVRGGYNERVIFEPIIYGGQQHSFVFVGSVTHRKLVEVVDS
jgi:mRNA interferase MazF